MEHLNNESAGARISEWKSDPVANRPRAYAISRRGRSSSEREPRHARRRQSIDKALPAGVPRVARNSALSATVRFAMTLRDDSSRSRLPWVCSWAKLRRGCCARKHQSNGVPSPL